MNYRNISTGAVISSSDFDRLPDHRRGDFVPTTESATHEVGEDDNGNFLISLAIGAATDSGLLGGMLGGNMLGGMLGDAMNDGDLDLI